MWGESGVPSAVGVVDDLLARPGWFPNFQVVILVYPVAWNLDGRDFENICARVDLTDDQVAHERRYPDSVRAREL